MAADRGRGGTLINVQALRALAAMLVVVFHMGDLTAALGVPQAQLSFAALGVDLFFVVSGFIMVYTTDAAPTSGRRFLLNRIARVVPLYWLVTLVVFAIALAAPSLMSRADGSWSGLLRSLFFIPYARADGRMEPVMFLGWSLNYEMFFYALFAVALGTGRGKSHVGIAIAALVALVLFGMLAQPPARTALAFYCNARVLEFAAGMLIARALPLLPSSRGAAIGGFVVGFLWMVATPLLFVDVAATLSICAACSLMLVSALTAERAGLRLDQPLVTLLGDASYSLYLVHPFAGQAVTKAWRIAGSSTAAAALALPLAIVASALLAILVYTWGEKPLAVIARRLLGTRRQAIPAKGL